MVDQHRNSQNAILKKKARIEEINLILAQPRQRGQTSGSVRRLIEERLHLEQAVAELEREGHRLQFQSEVRTENTGGFVDVASGAGIWRSFRSDFKALADEELTLDPGNQRDRWLRAYVDYEHQESDCGNWHISSGPTEDVRASFETLATRSGVALGAPRDTNPLDFWLHSLFLDLLKHASDHLRGARRDEGGIIVRVCEASATYCARLEKSAVEKSACESGQRLRRRVAGVSPAAKLADAVKFPTMTVQEVMAVVHLSRASVYRFLNEGRLDRPGLNKKPGKRSKTLVLTRSVQKMLRPQEE